jgi:hypothetical protein
VKKNNKVDGIFLLILQAKLAHSENIFDTAFQICQSKLQFRKLVHGLIDKLQIANQAHEQ